MSTIELTLPSRPFINLPEGVSLHARTKGGTSQTCGSSALPTRIDRDQGRSAAPGPMGVPLALGGKLERDIFMRHGARWEDEENDPGDQGE